MIVSALTIAASDPSSGAGIQSDLLVFSSLRVYGLSIITAVTAQNTKRFISIKPVDSIREQLDVVFEDFDISAIKIGVVYHKDIIKILYDYLKDIDKPIVIDPVIRSTTNAQLLKDDAYEEYKKLLDIATVITPNIQEAEVLTGIKINNIEDVKEACKRFSTDVIITGGHLDKPIDILYTNNKFYEFANEKIRGEFHGAGSIFSAALTAELAKGFRIVEACRIANRYTRYALENLYKIGGGLLIPSLIHYADDSILELQRGVDLIESMPNFHLLIPETQSNFVYAKDGVFGIEGRIVKQGMNVRAGYIKENASKHVADALSIARKYTEFRSAINIRYDERLIRIAERLGMRVRSYDRSKEPAEVKMGEGRSIRWGMEEAFTNDKPDIVYHKGDVGKEPMIIVFGKDPMDVIDKVKSLLDIYSAERSQ